MRRLRVSRDRCRVPACRLDTLSAPLTGSPEGPSYPRVAFTEASPPETAPGRRGPPGERPKIHGFLMAANRKSDRLPNRAHHESNRIPNVDTSPRSRPGVLSEDVRRPRERTGTVLRGERLRQGQAG